MIKKKSPMKYEGVEIYDYLFNLLQKAEKKDLLELIKQSYCNMNTEQKEIVFGKLTIEAIKKTTFLTGKNVLNKVKNFQDKSLKSYYYAPFEINSKNYMDLPEETDAWCSEISVLLEEACQLTCQEFHEDAIISFQILFDLIDRLGYDEIIFGDEIGSWLVSGDNKETVKYYITSLVKVTAVDVFLEHIIPLLKRDSCESFTKEVYKTALKLMTKEQKIALKKEIVAKNIRISKKIMDNS
jgi:hypothetical protein